MEKSDRISSAFIVFVPNKSLIIALIRFFGLRFFSLPESFFGLRFLADPQRGEIKSFGVFDFVRARRTSVRRACEIGRRKSENVKPYAGIRQDSDPLLAIMGSY